MAPPTTPTAPSPATIAEAYPATYLRYGQCLEIAQIAGIGQRRARAWIKTETLTYRQFGGPNSRRHYHRDCLLTLIFPNDDA